MVYMVYVDPNLADSSRLPKENLRDLEMHSGSTYQVGGQSQETVVSCGRLLKFIDWSTKALANVRACITYVTMLLTSMSDILAR